MRQLVRLPARCRCRWRRVGRLGIVKYFNQFDAGDTIYHRMMELQEDDSISAGVTVNYGHVPKRVFTVEQLAEEFTAVGRDLSITSGSRKFRLRYVSA